MDFEKQKPITDAYRKGWERVFGHLRERLDRHTHQRAVSEYQGKLDDHYVNGCPIISEGPQRDDL